jgi:prepilin-type N-terminal cleavage/methylation domain-containing protein
VRHRITDSEDRERGFTLVEMVATIVIMGLVMAPLCMALLQAMNLIPASSARTQVATDTDRLVSQFSDDVAQTQDYVNNPANTAGDPNSIYWMLYGLASDTQSQGTIPCPASAPTPVISLLVTPFWYDLTTAVPPDHPQTIAFWRLKFTNPGGGSTRLMVEVQRSADNATWPTYLTAYCAPGLSVATVTTRAPLDPVQHPNEDTDGSIGVKLVGLMDRMGNPLGPIEFVGKMRTGRVAIDPTAP